MSSPPPSTSGVEPRTRRSPDEPTLGDFALALWARRVRFLRIFLLLAAAGGTGLLLWRLLRGSAAEGTFALQFQGIERHEYPSGRKFAIEDLRSPQVLGAALTSAAIPPETLAPGKLAGRVEIEPVIPTQVLARWKRQDRDGVRREEYLPSEFRIQVRTNAVGNDQKVQILYAILKAYKDQVRFEQEAALRRVAGFIQTPAEQLIARYDYWDIPLLFRDALLRVREQIDRLVAETRFARDQSFHVRFRDLGNDLSTWELTQLEEVRAAVFRQRLVKDRDLMVKRLQHRRDELDVQVQQATSEAEDVMRLLEVADRPKPMLAGALTGRDGSPLIDATALEKLVKSDYVGPVVRRITDLRQTSKALEADRRRVDLELKLLSEARNVPAAQLPPGFAPSIAGTSAELTRIISAYNKTLEDYLSATISGLVTLKEGPRVVPDGPPFGILAVVVLGVAVGVAFLSVLLNASRSAR